MAVVLVVRPWGLLGRPRPRCASPPSRRRRSPLPPGPSALARAGALLAAAARGRPLRPVPAVDIFCLALFAASLHFIMGPGGMVSFGHAAYFGLGAYGAGLLVKHGGCRWSRAGAGAARRRRGGAGLRLVLRAALGRLPRHADARLRADQPGRSSSSGIAYRRHQRPGRHLAVGLARVKTPTTTCAGLLRAGIALLWRVLFSPFGYALRAGRDSPLRAEAIGIDLRA